MRKTSRASKGLIASLVVIVFLLIRGTKQQRALRLVLFSLWFPNPFGAVYDWFTAGLTAIPDAIKAWVRNIVFAIGDVFMQLVQDTVTVLGHIFQMIADLSRDFEHVINLLYGIVQGWVQYAVTYVLGVIHQIGAAIYDYVNAGFHAVVGWITSAGNAVASAAANALHTATDTLRGLIKDAVNFAIQIGGQAVAVARGLVTDAIGFLRGLIDQAVAFAKELAAQAVAVGLDAVHTVYDVLLRLVGEGIARLHDLLFAALDIVKDDVISTVQGLLADLLGPVMVVVDVVTEVIEWLVGLASFPFTTAKDLWEAMRNSNGPDVIDGMKAAHHRWGDHVTDHMKRYVG